MGRGAETTTLLPLFRDLRHVKCRRNCCYLVLPSTIVSLAIDLPLPMLPPLFGLVAATVDVLGEAADVVMSPKAETASLNLKSECWSSVLWDQVVSRLYVYNRLKYTSIMICGLYY
ncbi:hypothetical protein PIB30_009760 [Stylosanthes scabra]|uniref:Uncharacterized protein n=1 Tax=Stylosanthes scabra TaxID=79078 RepID=A0ABU6X3H4_9FABA|nr:hypothetical protein [Stylosanthes scabra]